MKHLYIPPVLIRLQRATWGYPLVRIHGLSLFTKTNDGALNIASYHPANSITWLWMLQVSFSRKALKPGRWISRVGRGWSVWALGLSVSWWTQEKMENGQ